MIPVEGEEGKVSTLCQMLCSTGAVGEKGVLSYRPFALIALLSPADSEASDTSKEGLKKQVKEKEEFVIGSNGEEGEEWEEEEEWEDGEKV